MEMLARVPSVKRTEVDALAAIERDIDALMVRLDDVSRRGRALYAAAADLLARVTVDPDRAERRLADLRAQAAYVTADRAATRAAIEACFARAAQLREVAS